MKIEDLLEPQWDLLLVRRDPSQRQVLNLHLPARYVKPCESAVVLKAGKLGCYTPGQRVVFQRGALTIPDLDLPREERQARVEDLGGYHVEQEPIVVGLVPAGQVLCTIRGDLAIPLDVDGFDHADAPYGQYLVERAKIDDTTSGGIVRPDGLHTSILAAEAIVRSKHPAADGDFEVGDRVLLSGYTPRSVPFGLLAKRVAWPVSGREILAKLSAAAGGAPLGDEDPIHLRKMPDFSEADGAVQFEEGDPGAPR